MKLRRNRWTIVVAVVWVVALALTTVMAPAQAEAEVGVRGWMTYSPNHPNGCVPLPYDCYFIMITSD
jgi:hypothetical protein